MESWIVRSAPLAFAFYLAAALLGCSVDSARNHYLLGEKLWTDQQYAAAVSEFEKVIAKDQSGKLGLQAMFRAATTQYLFLSQYGDAVKKFQIFIQFSQDAALIWESQLQIGEILFLKTEQYDQAIQHYRTLLEQNPTAKEAPEFLFRIGKSQFFLFQFDQAIQTYRQLIEKHIVGPFVEKAMYEIGNTYLAQGNDSYDAAKNAFKKFIVIYPKSVLVSDAKFGIASCMEELDQLDEAYEGFAALKGNYPSPDLIEMKIKRIRQRIAQRKVSR